MKKTLPLVLTFFVGIVGAMGYFVPAGGMTKLSSTLNDFGIIIAAVAFVLGGINIVQVNIPIVVRRRPDWGYKLVMLLSAVAVLLVGFRLHEFWAPAHKGTVAVSPVSDMLVGTPEAADTAIIVVDGAPRDLLVKIDGKAVLDPARPGEPARMPIRARVLVEKDAAGNVIPHVVNVSDTARTTPPRYDEYEVSISLVAGGEATVKPHLTYLLGPEGQPYLWLFNYIFAPCNATMFALLAFFITSAAFRAFRLRNVESGLLLGAAMLVMMGTIPLGAELSQTWLYRLQEWILSVPTVAGRRAIMMGAALGAVAIGLRVILGLERSHLGGD